MNAGDMVTVIIPIYNGARLLPLTLESLQNQTHKNFEALCINDGCTDDSVSIVKRIENDDTRFHLINQSNKGVAAARNKGLELAKGKYVAFLDQDDILPPIALERQIAVLSETGCDVACSKIHEFLDDDIPLLVSAGKGKCTISHEPICDFFSSNSSAGINVWGKLYCKKILVGLHFPQDVFGADDYVFSYRVFSNVSNYVYIDEPLYFYRMHSGSVTMQMPMRYIMGVLRSREIVWGKVCTNPAIDYNMRRVILKSFAYDIMSWAIKKTCRKSYPEGEMRALRDYVAILRRDGVLKPQRLKDRIKCSLFLSGSSKMLRLLFPKQYKQHSANYT